MNKYTVYYDFKGPDEINYGDYFADSEEQAMEEIIKFDTTRNIYSAPLEANMRYQGMSAVLINQPEPVPTVDESIETMKDNFEKLKQMYDINMEELAKLRASNMFGAHFHYADDTIKFVPIFTLQEDMKINGKDPISYTLNFDQKLLAFWITDLNSHIGKTKE